MIDSGQREDQNAGIPNVQERLPSTTPRIMVGSEAGELAVVEARTGRVCWLRRTKREPGTFALDGEVAVSVSGMPFAVHKRITSAKFDESIRQQIHVTQEATPAQLEARRTGDGALLWTYAHPKVMRRLYIEADAGVVVSASTRHPDADAPTMQALDAATGELLWERRDGSAGLWNAVTLCAVHGGRLYARLTDAFEQITALDIRSGRPLWERRFSDYRVFSPSGALIGEQRFDYDHYGTVALLDARDGTEVSGFPTDGVIRHLTDDGIAYVDGNTYEDATWIAALNARTGEELWRTSDVPHDHLALSGAILNYSRIIPERGNVEVGALDATTGARLWQWRTPGSLGELLRLWGTRRMPLMLWDSTEKSVGTLASIVWQPWFHLRRPPSRFREPPRQQTLRRRLRDIRHSIASNVSWPLWREFRHGHWRHPWALDGAMNANWLAARWGIVFLGTWVGLFALDAADGHLLWHALPTLNLSSVEPVLAP